MSVKNTTVLLLHLNYAHLKEGCSFVLYCKTIYILYIF